MNIFTPKGFLQVGGIILVLIAILGYVGIIGPTPESSIFGTGWWFDNAENVAHLVLGVVALLAAVVLKNAMHQQWLVAIVGVLGILFGVYSLFGGIPEGTVFMGANLENPLDTVLHLVVGAWALVAAFLRKNRP